jgi:tungstate transport system permease protein
MDAFLPIVALSLKLSLAATALATCVGLPLAAWLALCRFPGRRALVVLANLLVGLPPVVVGLVLYLLLAGPGPLGRWGLLFTPAAMVVAQAVLATPIVVALAHRVLAARWAEYGRAFLACGAGRLRALPSLLAMSRRSLATAVLAGFGRTVSDLGAVLIVGGNIGGQTRTMTTAMALETSLGNVELAVALGLALAVLAIAVSAALLLLGDPFRASALPGAGS